MSLGYDPNPTIEIIPGTLPVGDCKFCSESNTVETIKFEVRLRAGHEDVGANFKLFEEGKFMLKNVNALGEEKYSGYHKIGDPSFSSTATLNGENKSGSNKIGFKFGGGTFVETTVELSDSSVFGSDSFRGEFDQSKWNGDGNLIENE